MKFFLPLLIAALLIVMACNTAYQSTNVETKTDTAALTAEQLKELHLKLENIETD